MKRALDWLRPVASNAWALARGQVASVALVFLAVLIATSTVVVLGGQAADNERKVLDRFDSPEQRLVVVQDDTGRAGINMGSTVRLREAGLVDWAIAMGPVSDVEVMVREVKFGMSSMRVSEVDDLEGLSVVSGRTPRQHEALIEVEAAREIGLRIPVGWLAADDGTSVPIVGFYRSPPGTDRALPDALVGGRPETLTRLALQVPAGTDTNSLTPTILAYLEPFKVGDIDITTSADVGELRRAIAGDLGRSSRRIASIVVVVSAGLVLVSGAIAVGLRRQHYGLMRCLGSTRTQLGVSVLLAFGVAAGLAAVFGGFVGLVAIRLQGWVLIPRLLVAGPLLLACVSVFAAAVPATLAGLRDPVRVLRGS